MYVHEKIVCLVLLLVSASTVRGQTVTNSSADGFGYEMITSKLDYLQYKLIEMDLTIKEDQETIGQQLSHQETLSDGLLWAIHQLDQRIDDNLTALQTNSNSALKEGRASMDQKLSDVAGEISHLREAMSYNFTRLQNHYYSAVKGVQEVLNQQLSGLTGVINKLSLMISHNITSIQTKTDKMLAQQIACANHEQMRKDIQQLTAKEGGTQPRVSLDAKSSKNPIRSCKEELMKQSGKYLIQPTEFDQPFLGYCDQDAFGGGWLVIQHRYNGSLDFNRTWADYRNGFGSVDGEFWLGLEQIHRLTSARSYWLLVELKDFSGNYSFALYNEFEIGSEEEQYAIKKLGSYIGTAGDALYYHKDMKFTTIDRDNDNSTENMAFKCGGGWWYKNIPNANLNGIYMKGTDGKAMYWYNYKISMLGMAYSRILIHEV